MVLGTSVMDMGPRSESRALECAFSAKAVVPKYIPAVGRPGGGEDGVSGEIGAAWGQMAGP